MACGRCGERDGVAIYLLQVLIEPPTEAPEEEQFAPIVTRIAWPLCDDCYGIARDNQPIRPSEFL